MARTGDRRPGGPERRRGPRLRRAYFETRFGQLHVHHAIPPGGGFDEGPALVCCAPLGGIGRPFRPYMALSGRDRPVYAADTPGFGESDGPVSPPLLADYAGALVDFLDAMRFRSVDLVGSASGSLLAAEVALTRPALIRRVVMVSAPLPEEAERSAWRRAQRPEPPLAYGPNPSQPWWANNALMSYAARDRLALLQQPVLVVRPRDSMWESTARVRATLKNARGVDLPDCGEDVFAVSPLEVQQAVAEFLA